MTHIWAPPASSAQLPPILQETRKLQLINTRHKKEKSQHHRPEQHQSSDDARLQAGSRLTYIAREVPLPSLVTSRNRDRVVLNINMTHLTSAINLTNYSPLVTYRREPNANVSKPMGRGSRTTSSRLGVYVTGRCTRK